MNLSILRRRSIIRARRHASRRRKTVRRITRALAIGSLLASAAVFAEPSDVNDAAGSIAKGEAPESVEIGAGSGTVSSQTGSFQYSFPITVPPGRLGAAPSLALSYSSQSSVYGGVAAGWSLGLPVIQRRYAGADTYNQASWVSSLAGGRELIASPTEPVPASGTSYRARGDSSFARYQLVGATWRVLQTDGSVLHFGEVGYIGGWEHWDSWKPLTRQVDSFGNQVEYHWEPVLDASGDHVELRISRIEYSANPSAALLPHATVDFNYGTPTQCNGPDSLPVGASLSYRSGAKRVDGYAPLVSIVTSVGAAAREVRRYDLDYDSSALSCVGPSVPRRLLTSITEKATSPEGVLTSIPAVSFSYGAEATWGAPVASAITAPVAGGRFLPHGTRRSIPAIIGRFDHDDSRLLDIDGDSLVDWVTVVGTTSCSLYWYKNEGRTASGGVTFSGPNLTSLPSFPSAGGGAPEHCSMSGEFSMWRHPSAPPLDLGETYQGARLLYEFRDYDGDGFVDILTGLSGVAEQLGPTALGYKSNVDCPEVDINGLIGEDGPGWDVDPEDVLRQAIGFKSGCYGRGFYKNVADGSGRAFVFQGVFNTPFPVSSNAREVVPSGSFTYSKVPESLVDMDGDGRLDYLSVRKAQASPQIDPAWFSYLQSTASGSGIETGTYWISPFDYRSLWFPSETRREALGSGNDHYYEKVTVQLTDVNGDGLPDLYRNITGANDSVGFNIGTRFLDQQDVGPPLQLSEAEVSVTGNSGNINLTGYRSEHARSGDYNGDGRSDFIDTVTNQVYLGLGDGHFLQTSSGSDAYRQFLLNGDDGPGWDITEDTIDLNGDGLLDRVTEGIGGAVTVTWMETGAAPPAVLESVDNGRGLGLDITYAPHTDNAVVSLAGGEQPGPLWVVAGMTQRHTIGTAPDSTSSYYYVKPVRTEDDFGKLGFRGFDSVRTRAPSGAVSEERFAYDLDWSGRRVATLSYSLEATGPPSLTTALGPPTTIVDTAWSELSTFGAESYHVTETREYVCEVESGGGVATLNEGDCRAQTTPLTSLTVFDGALEVAGEPVAQVPVMLVRGERAAAGNFINAHCKSTTFDVAYAADDFRVVSTLAFMTVGNSTPPTPFDTIPPSPCPSVIAGITETAYDAALRVPLSECAARSIADFNGHVSVDSGAVCTRIDIDPSTGLKLREQSPEEYANDDAAGQNWVTGVTTYEYGSGYQLFVTKVTNALGHEVVATTDLGTGVLLSSHGPNEYEGGYLEVDGFGRPLHEFISIGEGSGQTYNYRRKRDVTYNDTTIPQTVTERHTRMLGTEQQLASTSNSWWAEIKTTYDGAGRVTEVYEAALTAPVEDPSTRVFTYDASGNLVSAVTPDPSKPKYATGSVAYLFSYDVLGRRTCARSPDGSGVATIYAGRRVKSVEFGGDGGDCANPTDPLSDAPRGATIVESDMFGRAVRVEERTDAALETYAHTLYSYDGNSNIATIERQDSTDGDIVVSMTHDFVGNRTEINRHGRSWAYTYDRNGNVSTQLAPVPVQGVPTDYTISILYDELGRPESRLVPDGGLDSTERSQLAISDLTYLYDSGEHGLGRLSRTTTGIMNIDMTYDARGNVKTTSRTIEMDGPGGPGIPLDDSLVLTNLSWNSFGQPQTVIHPSGRKTYTHYHRWPSTAKHIYLYTDDGKNEYFLNSRNAAGAVKKLMHFKVDNGNQYGRYIFYGHDTLARVTQNYSNDSGDDKISQTATYYGTSEVATLATQVGPVTGIRNFNFSYDDQHQLTAASDDKGYTSAFSYTTTGRLKTAHVTASGGPGTMVEDRNVSYEYNAADPEIVTGLVDSPTAPLGLDASYVYDEAGNMTQRFITGGSFGGSVTHDLVYDAENRLRIRKLPDGTEERYFYHGPQRWLAVNIGTTGTATGARQWFGDEEIEYTCTPTWCSRTTEKTYIRLGGQTVARVDKDVASGVATSKVIHTNGLGHTLGIYSYSLEPTGLEYRLDVGFQYGPFGEILETVENPGATASDYLERFNGKELDTATGLSYYGYRYFDPLGLVWNRSDPLFRLEPDLAVTQPRRVNLYTFSANNPVRFVDTDGRDWRKLLKLAEPFDIKKHVSFAKKLYEVGGEAAVDTNGRLSHVLGAPVTPEQERMLNSPGVQMMKLTAAAPLSIALSLASDDPANPTERGGSPSVKNKTADKGSSTFFHGTTRKDGEAISPGEGRGNLQPVSTNTAPYSAGSFFTTAASEANAKVAASHWALRKTSSPDVVVVEMKVPNRTLRALEAGGHVRTSSPAGTAFPNQTVFSPAALGVLNKLARFRIIDPDF